MITWLLLLLQYYRGAGAGQCTDGIENTNMLDYGFEDGTLMGWTGEGFRVSNNTLLKAHSGKNVLTQIQTVEEGYPLLEWNFYGSPGEAVGMDLIEDSTMAHRDGSVLEIPSLGVYKAVNAFVDLSSCLRFNLDTALRADSLTLTLLVSFRSTLDLFLSLNGVQVGSVRLAVSPDTTIYQKDFAAVTISEFSVCRDWMVVGTVNVRDYAIEPVERLPSRFVEGQRESVDANAASFSGPAGPHNTSLSYITLPLSQGLDNFTIAFWLKTNDIGGASGRNWYDGKGLVEGNRSDFGVSLLQGKIAFGIGRSTVMSGVINDGGWHSVAATRSSTTIRLYVDGMEVSRGRSNTGIRSSLSLTIGSTSDLRTPGSLEGMIDDVRVYSRASADLVQDASRASHTSSFLVDLVRWLKLDGDVLDSSPQAIQNVIQKNVTWNAIQGGALELTSDAVLYTPEFTPLPFEPCFYSAATVFRGSESTTTDVYDLGPLTTTSHRLTMAVWIRPSDLTSGAKIFDMGNSHSSDRVSMGIGMSRALEYAINEQISSSKLTSKSVLLRNEWMHVAVIHTSGGTIDLLLNGASIARKELTPSPRDTRRQFAYLGSSLSSTDPMWAGIIKDFFLWDTALSVSDLNKIRTRDAITVPLSSSLLATSALAFGCAENKFCYSNAQVLEGGDMIDGVIDTTVSAIPAGTRKGFSLAKRLCSLRLSCTRIFLSSLSDGYRLLISNGTSSLLIGSYWEKQRCGSDVCATVEYHGNTTTGGVMLTCPLGSTISAVVFADYGTPSTNLITDGNFSLVKTDTALSLITCSFAGNVGISTAYYGGTVLDWQVESGRKVVKFTQKPGGVLSFIANRTRGSCSTAGLKFVCTTDDSSSPWRNLRSSAAFRVQIHTRLLATNTQSYKDWANNTYDDSSWAAPCLSTVADSTFGTGANASFFRQSTAIWGGNADYAYFRISVGSQTTQGTWAIQNGEFIIGNRLVSASLCSNNVSRPSRLFQTFATRPFTTYDLRFSYFSQVAGAQGNVVIEGESPSEPVFFQSSFGPSLRIGSWSNQRLSFVAKTELTTLSFRSTSCITVDDIRVSTTAQCGGYVSDPSCYAPGTKQLVEQQCLGRNQCLPSVGDSVTHGCSSPRLLKHMSILVMCNSSLSTTTTAATTTTTTPPTMNTNTSSTRLLRYDFYNNMRATALKDVKWDKPTFSGSSDFATPQLAQPTTTYHPEHFAVRWVGNFKATQTGLYYFALSSKDGSELYIDEKMLIVNEGVHAMKSVGGKINLNAGLHSIYVRWFYAATSSVTKVFSLQYKPPSNGLSNEGLNCSVACGNRTEHCTFCGTTGRCCRVGVVGGGCSGVEGGVQPVCVAGGAFGNIPADLLSHPVLMPSALLDSDASGFEAGVTYEYRPITDQKSISLEKLDFSIAPHRRGVLPYVGLWKMEHDDYFSLRFAGRLRVPQSGLYTFFIRSDDGAVLRLGGSMVVWNNEANDASQTAQGSAELAAGYYDLELLYYEGYGEQILQLEWQGPGFTRQAVGNSVLSHRMLMPALNFGANESFTVETSIKTTAQSRTLVSKMSILDGGRVDTGWWLQLSRGILQFWVAATQEQKVVSGEIVVNDNNWHHVAAVRDAATQELRIYVDYRLDAVTYDSTVALSLASQATLALGLSPATQDTYEEDVIFDFLKVSAGAISPANFKNAPSTLVKQHPTYMLRSPPFRFASASNEIKAWVVGGGGGPWLDGMALSTIPAVSSPDGFLGLALVRLTDNIVIATMRVNSMIWTLVNRSWTPADSIYYQLVFIDAYHKATSTDRPDWFLVDDIQLTGVAWCSCPPNTAGLQCELSNARSCKGHGTVIEEGGSTFHCECDLGWFGDDCSSACPGFHGAGGKDICNGHGQCYLAADNKQECECDEAWNRSVTGFCTECTSGLFGNNCSKVCPGGKDDVCSQHGICDDGLTGAGGCKCEKNWVGLGCAESITEVISPGEDTVWETDKRYPIVWNSQGDIDIVALTLVSVTTKAQTKLGIFNNTGLIQVRINSSQATGMYFVRISGEPSLNTLQESEPFEIRTSSQSTVGVPPPPETSSNPAGLIVGLSILFLFLLLCAALYKFKRVAITEWLLWKLGNFRFHSLRVQKEQAEGNNREMEGNIEIPGHTEIQGPQPIETEGEQKDGQHIEMI